MKAASNVAERIEEYNYHSSSMGDVRPMSLKVLAVRLTHFHKVMRKVGQAANRAGGSKQRKRGR